MRGVQTGAADADADEACEVDVLGAVVEEQVAQVKLDAGCPTPGVSASRQRRKPREQEAATRWRPMTTRNSPPKVQHLLQWIGYSGGLYLPFARNANIPVAQ